jgi:bifunctional oligoribonuclease and PAP phosphatase NrnA
LPPSKYFIAPFYFINFGKSKDKYMQIDIRDIVNQYSQLQKTDSKIVIFSHINPDGDAVGSALGLFHYLKNTVRDIKVILPNRFPDFLDFLPGADEVLFFDKQTKLSSGFIADADFLFFLDFNDPERIEKMGKKAMVSKAIKIMIDHHPEPVNFADFSISDTSVCSTAELIYEFIRLLDDKKGQNKEMADCLMAGIITDTGLFNHNSEQRRTYEIVAELLDLGADKDKIVQKIYNEYPFHRMQLLGNALHNRLSYHPAFNTAFIWLPKEDLEKYHHQNGDTEGFVNIPLSIAGIKFSALFIEKEDHIKCSFRSTGSFDVNLFARNYFNGGGHLNASGGKSFAPLNKTIEHFVQLLKKHQNEII